jgi:hypothetical protein
MIWGENKNVSEGERETICCSPRNKTGLDGGDRDEPHAPRDWRFGRVHSRTTDISNDQLELGAFDRSNVRTATTMQVGQAACRPQMVVRLFFTNTCSEMRHGPIAARHEGGKRRSPVQPGIIRGPPKVRPTRVNLVNPSPFLCDF